MRACPLNIASIVVAALLASGCGLSQAPAAEALTVPAVQAPALAEPAADKSDSRDAPRLIAVATEIRDQLPDLKDSLDRSCRVDETTTRSVISQLSSIIKTWEGLKATDWDKSERSWCINAATDIYTIGMTCLGRPDDLLAEKNEKFYLEDFAECKNMIRHPPPFTPPNTL